LVADWLVQDPCTHGDAVWQAPGADVEDDEGEDAEEAVDANVEDDADEDDELPTALVLGHSPSIIGPVHCGIGVICNTRGNNGSTEN
jgi:hypothetical protein